MRSLFIGGLAAIAALVVACETRPAEEQANSQSEIQMVRTGGPTCSGWGCAIGVRPTTDKELFDALKRLSLDESASANPNIVKLASLECAAITGGCNPSTCFARTMCGGGGPVMGAEAATIDFWLRTRNVQEEKESFASRRRALNLECVRSTATGAVACSFAGNSSASSDGR